jgi:ABC-type transport system substrate-binding protein
VVSLLLLLLLAACSVPAPEVRAPTAAEVDVAAAPLRAPRVPTGTVRVAYPDPPAGFLDLTGHDPAATDLAALWGLPLFRTDPAGQLAPGLVERWELVETDAGDWTVELTLRGGSWSDGAPVVAEDVVATLTALREGARARELAPLTAAAAAGERLVRLTFDRPYARWWALLDGVGVLPARVLGEFGTAAYADEVPVSGGWFAVAEHVPGLRTIFVAHPDGPLEAPGVERLEVLVVPRYETALGLLRNGEVDAVVGYLALNAVERTARVAGVEAEAPIGGTTVGLRWRADGPLGDADAAARRRAVGAAIDVSQLVEGLLGAAGEIATSPVPGVEGPGGRAPAAETVAVGEPVVAFPRWQEALAFTARAIQRDLRIAGGGLSLRAEPPPEVVDVVREEVDGGLLAWRTGPRPTFAGTVQDATVAVAADAAGPGTPAFAEALEQAAEDALVLPLYRVGVAHVWSPVLANVRPSAWSGLGFWDAGSWTVTRG